MKLNRIKYPLPHRPCPRRPPTHTTHLAVSAVVTAGRGAVHMTRQRPGRPDIPLNVDMWAEAARPAVLTPAYWPSGDRRRRRVAIPDSCSDGAARPWPPAAGRAPGRLAGPRAVIMNNRVLGASRSRPMSDPGSACFCCYVTTFDMYCHIKAKLCSVVRRCNLHPFSNGISWSIIANTDELSPRSKY